jgi:hypothetical protein
MATLLLRCSQHCRQTDQCASPLISMQAIAPLAVTQEPSSDMRLGHTCAAPGGRGRRDAAVITAPCRHL